MADQNPANEDGTTPLHDAAIEGHLDIVRLILANVEDKNPADSESGETPLHFAARVGHHTQRSARICMGPCCPMPSSRGLRMTA